LIEGKSLASGYQLQEYVIERVLGAGGFGITYLATDSHLHRPVAIKEYFPSHLASRSADGAVAHFAGSSESADEFAWGLSRFIDEARTLAKFEHPNVIRVVRYFEANGTAYIVMDYAAGRPLSSVIKEAGSLREQDVLAMLMPLLDGLERVHASGLLHRDIKPHNIIIRDDGSPVLIDFGAARQAIGVLSQSISTIVTPGFAPIEQYSARGNQGPWTDLYALGGIAYACLTGHPPPEATERIRSDSLVPIESASRTKVSRGFAAAVTWALQPEEQDRPQSIAAWRSALLGHGTGQADARTKASKTAAARTAGGAARPKTPLKLGYPLIGLLAVGFVAVVGVLVWQLFGSSLGGSTKVVNAGAEASYSEPGARQTDSAAPSAPGPEQRQVPDAAPGGQHAEPPRPAQPAPAPGDKAMASKETEDYLKAQEIDIREAYVLFLRLHPDGKYADLAQHRLDDFGG
jgi:hypothetical protein